MNLHEPVCPGVWICALWLGVLVGCAPTRPEPVRIYAAVSTQEAIQQLAADFQAETGISVEANLGASSDLARQIAHGGAADLFLSADEVWADYLADKGLTAQPRDLLTNRLVVVVPADSALAVDNLRDVTGPEVHRLALAGEVVPAGRYAREALRRAGVWDRIRDRVLDGGNVRETLTFVARREAEAGLVYATDAAASERVRVALPVPPDLCPPIRYPLVLIRGEQEKAVAGQFFDYLFSEHAAALFRQHGFGVSTPGESPTGENR
jgi:molybdate transport system substrate-binding protein